MPRDLHLRGSRGPDGGLSALAVGAVAARETSSPLRLGQQQVPAPVRGLAVHVGDPAAGRCPSPSLPLILGSLEPTRPGSPSAAPTVSARPGGVRGAQVQTWHCPRGRGGQDRRPRELWEGQPTPRQGDPGAPAWGPQEAAAPPAAPSPRGREVSWLGALGYRASARGPRAAARVTSCVLDRPLGPLPTVQTPRARRAGRAGRGRGQVTGEAASRGSRARCFF